MDGVPLQDALLELLSEEAEDLWGALRAVGLAGEISAATGALAGAGRALDLAQFLLRLLPDRHGFLGQMQAQLGHERHGEQPGVGQDELFGRHHP